jgi:hypothetical protein
MVMSRVVNIDNGLLKDCSSPLAAAPYEQRLSSSISYVLDEGGKLFMGQSEVHQTLRRITDKLNDLQIPYAVAGGMALIAHGFRRFTEDIDILVTQESLDRIHENLDGLGWVRPFSTSKNLRDATNGVRVEFLVSGGFPGDGKPKPVSFPAPDAVAEVHEGISYLNLPTFVTLKLASGMTNPQRGKDLTDVAELIHTLPLDQSFAEQLNPFVQSKFVELWQQQQTSANRFLAAWNCPLTTSPLQSIEELMHADATPSLRELASAGIQVAKELSIPGQAILFTHDRATATKYGLVDEFEVDLKKLRDKPMNGA